MHCGERARFDHSALRLNQRGDIWWECAVCREVATADVWQPVQNNLLRNILTEGRLFLELFAPER